jgi:hypothetical protein
MAPLSWNLLGWAYQDGIRNLRETFAAATDGVKERLRASYEAVDEYDRQVAAGAEPLIERDEDGIVICDQRDMLIYHTTTAEEAKDALNKALAISMFHHWERSARQWTSVTNGRFSTLRDRVIADGQEVHPGLYDFYLVVNLLKHGNRRHGCELLERRPGWFRRRLADPGPGLEWYEEVRLSDADLDELFEILTASGPDISTQPRKC